MAHKLKNLHPDVARELLRHVKPNPRLAKTNTNNKNSSSSTKVLLGCTAFVAFAGSLPYWATQTIGNLTEKEEALSAAQVRRVVFMNSGSTDAVYDPNLDLKYVRCVCDQRDLHPMIHCIPNE